MNNVQYHEHTGERSMATYTRKQDGASGAGDARGSSQAIRETDGASGSTRRAGDTEYGRGAGSGCIIIGDDSYKTLSSLCRDIYRGRIPITVEVERVIAERSEKYARRFLAILQPVGASASSGKSGRVKQRNKEAHRQANKQGSARWNELWRDSGEDTREGARVIQDAGRSNSKNGSAYVVGTQHRQVSGIDALEVRAQMAGGER